jgi:hypothetical protein
VLQTLEDMGVAAVLSVQVNIVLASGKLTLYQKVVLGMVCIGWSLGAKDYSKFVPIIELSTAVGCWRRCVAV